MTIPDMAWAGEPPVPDDHPVMKSWRRRWFGKTATRDSGPKDTQATPTTAEGESHKSTSIAPQDREPA